MLREKDIPFLVVVFIVVLVSLWIGERGCDFSPLPKMQTQKLEQR